MNIPLLEQFRFVDGYDNYQVSNMGRVRNVKTMKILKNILDNTGYYIVNLCKDGKGKKHQIHRLVAEAFIENPDDKPCVDHIDHNKTNNSIENLRFVSYSENNMNKSKRNDNKSGVPNIYFDKSRNRWRVNIKKDGTNVYFKRHKTLEDAIEDRKQKIQEIFGEYANQDYV